MCLVYLKDRRRRMVRRQNDCSVRRCAELNIVIHPVHGRLLLLALLQGTGHLIGLVGTVRRVCTGRSVFRLNLLLLSSVWVYPTGACDVLSQCSHVPKRMIFPLPEHVTNTKPYDLAFPRARHIVKRITWPFVEHVTNTKPFDLALPRARHKY